MRTMPRVVLMLALAGLAGGTPPAPLAAQAAPRESLSLPGLRQPVEVIRDCWGPEPHLRAERRRPLHGPGLPGREGPPVPVRDLAPARHRTVAEILGPRELTRDIGTRLHKFRGNLDAELNHYHPRGKAIIEAYVRGVNAAVDEAMKSPSTLPIEFRMLGITPGKWTPEVVVPPCHQALTSNVENEATHVRALAALGADRLKDLLWLQGGDPPLTLDPLVDPKTFPADVLKTYTAFRDTIRFQPDDIAPAYRGDARAALEAMDDGSRLALTRSADGNRIVDTDIGSNNWVVSGAKTQSSMPILANDPHRVIEAPSLRYWVHLVAPGWNVIGGGEPVLPGVSIGHNEHGAWGLTISAPTRKTSTSTRRIRPTRTSIAIRAAGRRCASSPSRSP